MADVSVRPAGAGDAPAIARIQLETWQQAYAGWLPQSVLAGIPPDAAERSWREAVTAPPSRRHHVLVACERDWLVGFVAFGPEPEPGPEAGAGDPAAGQIAALLVEPRWGRRGHGSRMLAATVEHMRADGLRAARVWVPEPDAASLAFYTSAGWARDGYARSLETDGASVTEVRLHVSLEEDP